MLDGRGLVRTGNYLYQDDVGRDACGIGGVAARDGKPCHEVLHKAVVALKNMEHRGGLCGQAGDGAGLVCQVPQAFLKEEAKRLKLDQARYLKPEHRLAVGAFFLDADAAKADQARALVREALAGGPLHWLRPPPVPPPDHHAPPPSRPAAHPGEITRAPPTRHAVHAYSRALQPAPPGGDLLPSKMSDSASLDEWVEHLVHDKRWSLLRALRLSMPPVWDSEAD